MINRTKAEHLQWAKERALTYLAYGPAHDPRRAIVSFINDLSEHPETKSRTIIEAAARLRGVCWESNEQVHKFLEAIAPRESDRPTNITTINQ